MLLLLQSDHSEEALELGDDGDLPIMRAAGCGKYDMVTALCAVGLGEERSIHHYSSVRSIHTMTYNRWFMVTLRRCS